MTERETLLANCLEQPGDDTARLVYADWLREQNDPLGDFLWGGVTLSRYRGDEPREGEFWYAQRAIDDTAEHVLSNQLPAVLGWPWQDVFWDKDAHCPDRLRAVVMPKSLGSRRRTRVDNRLAAIYERGMLTALRLPRSVWRANCASILAACPLERVSLLDVPGLTLIVERHDEPPHWRLVGQLDLPGRNRRAPIAHRFTYPASVATRAQLLEHANTLTDECIEFLCSRVGDRSRATLDPV